DPEQARQRAWYLPNQDHELPLPSGNRIRRVIGRPDPFAYQIGGATILKRLDYYLKRKFSKSLSGYSEVLDWGCGCGRIARNFQSTSGVRYWGVDVDCDTISWCRDNLRHGLFLTCQPVPPLPFPDNSFDL